MAESEAQEIPILTAVGLTGHQGLPPSTETLIARAIESELKGMTRLVGISALADGADQILAESVLHCGGRLVVVRPCRRYEDTFTHPDARARYNSLLEKAEAIVDLPYEQPSEEAFWAAGQEVVDRCDFLLAVWDGKPAGGLGGTADVVRYARDKGRSVVVVWPDGARRAAPGGAPSVDERAGRAIE